MYWFGVVFCSDQIKPMRSHTWLILFGKSPPAHFFFFLIVLFSRKEKTYDSTSKNYTIYKTDNQ